jgi:hypothetical protein
MCVSGLGAAAGGAGVVSCTVMMGAVTGSAAGGSSGVGSRRAAGAGASLGVSVAGASMLQDVNNNGRSLA